MLNKNADLRSKVLAAVRAYPGQHVRAIERQLGVSSSLAFYHLKALLEDGAVKAAKFGGSVRYFPTTGAAAELSAADRRAVALLRDETNLRVVLYLLDFGPSPLRKLAEEMRTPKSSLHYHLERLADERLVGRVGTGDETTYRVPQEARVRGLLMTFKPTKDLIDRAGDLWEDLYG